MLTLIGVADGVLEHDRGSSRTRLARTVALRNSGVRDSDLLAKRDLDTIGRLTREAVAIVKLARAAAMTT